MRKEKETQRFSSLSLKIPIIEYSTSANQDICAIPILHFLQFLEIFRRNLPIFSLETPAEISHAIHTYHKGDLTDAILTLQKQMLGILHLILADIFVGRYTRERLHLAIERTGTYRQVTGNQVNIHITTDILFYQLIQLVKEFLIYLIERFPQLLFLLIPVSASCHADAAARG